jgi:RHS repeat-associated protein
VVTNDIMLRSVNGPEHTFIVGAKDPGSTNGPAAVRCVFLETGSCIEGFTLTNGATVASSWRGDSYGGGIYSGGNRTTYATNCIITGCSAGEHGGGSYLANLTACMLNGNQAQYGGGASGGEMVRCTFENNRAEEEGGGQYDGYMYSCLVRWNRAGTHGGGSSRVELNNCTVIDNTAMHSCGGSYGASWVQNSIVRYNTAPERPNLADHAVAYSCTWPLMSGEGNTDSDPGLAGIYSPYLLADSACIDTGENDYWMDDALDWAGSNRIYNTTVDRGCYEYRPAERTGTLTAAVSMNYTNVAVGREIVFKAVIGGDGIADSLVWHWPDGDVSTNLTSPSRTFTTAGVYEVELVVTNSTMSVAATNRVTVIDATVYVATNGGHVSPFSSWAGAATSIQAAVDAAVPGQTILVSNGLYNAGGVSNYPSLSATSNRVAVYKPLFVRSVNGPGYTTIAGRWHDGYPGGAVTNEFGAAAVRGVYLCDGSELHGFTVTNGATGYNGDAAKAQSGGGIWAAASAVVSNCIISGNASRESGGGVYGGQIRNSRLCGNKCDGNGGGAAGASHLVQCEIYDNFTESRGAGLADSTGVVCKIYNNLAWTGGGGTVDSDLYSCLVEGNSVYSGNGGGCHGGTLYNSTLVGNQARLGGGSYASYITNCIVYYNHGTSAGPDEEGENIYSLSSRGVGYTCSYPLQEGTNNFSSAPLFRDPGADYGTNHIAGDYRLLKQSPCLDMGMLLPWMTNRSDPRSVDLQGSPRLKGDYPDLGAYEWTFAVSPRSDGLLAAGDSLRFAAEITAVNYRWSFGTNLSSDVPVPGYVRFPDTGIQTARLFAVDQNGTNQFHAWTFDVQPNSGSLPDLQVARMVYPATARAGGPLTVYYMITNAGAGTFSGSREDTLFFSTDQWLDSGDTPLARNTETNQLAPGESYESLFSADLPLTGNGVYYLIASLDSQWTVLDEIRMNNQSVGEISLAVETLTRDEASTFRHPAGAVEQYYRIAITNTGNVELTLTTSTTGLQVYAACEEIPDREHYDYAMSDGRISIPAASVGNWYLLVEGSAIPAAGLFSLTYTMPTYQVNDWFPQTHHWTDDLTMTLTGNGFNPPMTVELVYSNTLDTYEGTVTVDDYSQMTVSFEGAHIPSLYGLRVTDSAGTEQMITNAIEFMRYGIGDFRTRIIAPAFLGYHMSATIYIEYWNEGNVDVPSHLVTFTAMQGEDSRKGAYLTLDEKVLYEGFWSADKPPQYSPIVSFIASGETPGVIRAGETNVMAVYYAGWEVPWDMNYPPIRLRARAKSESNPGPMHWETIKDGARPDYVQADAWDAIWSNFVARAGNTRGDYISLLNRNIRYLDRIEQPTLDEGQLFAFLLRQADALNLLSYLSSRREFSPAGSGIPLTFERVYAQPISRRYALGPMGRGWVHNWQVSLNEATNGAVRIIPPDGTPRIFLPAPDWRSGYFAMPGDSGQLETKDGGFLLTEANGLKEFYNAGGQLIYREDRNSNRITCAWSSGRLSTLTHSSGASLSFTYNGNERIATVTDHLSRQATYTYSGDGEYLERATSPDGMIYDYTYDKGTNIARLHALRTITTPSGLIFEYQYDTQGRISQLSWNGDSNPVTFDYGECGQVELVSAAGGTNEIWFDTAGRATRLQNANNSIILALFNEVGNLVGLRYPDGSSDSLSYDEQNRLARWTDAHRNETLFHYTDFNNLRDVTEPNGNQVRYTYDSRGNRTGITYPGGGTESRAYDAQGNMTAITNARGQVITMAYDAVGRVTNKNVAGSDPFDYTYDAFGRLVSASNAAGVYTYAYETNDWLKQAGFPSDRNLNYTRTSSGLRASMTNENGQGLVYQYDVAGRLTNLTDAAGSLLETRAYNSGGRLAMRTLGNGARAAYVYDAAGYLTGLTNYLPDGSVHTYYNYAYDLLGRRTAIHSSLGTWSNTYDQLGRLTDASFYSNTFAIPDQAYTYAYDPLGNRTNTMMNSTQTVYTVNARNQYTERGDVQYTYDADGNLTNRFADGASVIFNYNAENRLTAITRTGTTWRCVYDPFGRRAALSRGGQTNFFVVDPLALGNVVEILDESGSTIAQYDYAPDRLLRSRIPATNYYSYDAVYSVDGLISQDGTLSACYAYQPFGDVLYSQGSSENPFDFIGGLGVQRDPTALLYMRARYYDPEIGRFLSRDPLGVFSDGMNLYLYAGNDPFRFSDPSGEKWGCGWQWGGDHSHAFGFGIGVSEGHSFGLSAGVGAGTGWSVGPGGWIGPSGAAGPNLGLASAGLGTAGAGLTGSAGFGEFSGWSFGASAGYSYGRSWGYFCGWSEDQPEDEDDERRRELDERDDDEDDGDSESSSESVGSSDPNRKMPPAGYGPGNYVPAGELVYRIDFENETNATAPAQIVTVSDTLSTNLNPASVRLLEFGFGDQLFTVDSPGTYYTTTYPMTQSGVTFNVRIEGDVNQETREIYVSFVCLDPDTGLPPPAGYGFLPPEDGSMRGMGHVTFGVQPDNSLPSGTAIRNVATIQFDYSEIIDTNQKDPHDPSQGIDTNKEALITLDTTAPTSTVSALPAVTETREIAVAWNGSDDPNGSGIAGYDIYVATNDGPWTLWLTNTASSSGTYTGALNETGYGFYSIAIDGVGHRETKAAVAEATTRVEFAEGGSLQVTLTPTQAVSDGAQWAVPAGGITNWRSSGETQNLATGTHTVVFNRPEGWYQPTNRQVSITYAQLTELSVPYTIAIPTNWLATYGLPTDHSADFIDTDGDTFDNWSEWRAMTDPTNALSYFRLIQVDTSPQGNTRLTWISSTGRLYTIEQTTNLMGSGDIFSILVTNIAGQADQCEYTVTNSQNEGIRVLRVNVQD